MSTPFTPPQVTMNTRIIFSRTGKFKDSIAGYVTNTRGRGAIVAVGTTEHGLLRVEAIHKDDPRTKDSEFMRNISTTNVYIWDLAPDEKLNRDASLRMIAIEAELASLKNEIASIKKAKPASKPAAKPRAKAAAKKTTIAS